MLQLHLSVQQFYCVATKVRLILDIWRYLIQSGWNKMADILQKIFWKSSSLKKMLISWLKFPSLSNSQWSWLVPRSHSVEVPRELKHKISSINTLIPGRSGCYSTNAIFNLFLLIHIFRSSYDNASVWMWWGLTVDKLTMVQVMALLSGSKPLPEFMLTKIYIDHHMVSWGCTDLSLYVVILYLLHTTFQHTFVFFQSAKPLVNWQHL